MHLLHSAMENCTTKYYKQKATTVPVLPYHIIEQKCLVHSIIIEKKMKLKTQMNAKIIV